LPQTPQFSVVVESVGMPLQQMWLGPTTLPQDPQLLGSYPACTAWLLQQM
jgi:hypothetical protein